MATGIELTASLDGFRKWTGFLRRRNGPYRVRLKLDGTLHQLPIDGSPYLLECASGDHDVEITLGRGPLSLSLFMHRKLKVHVRPGLVTQIRWIGRGFTMGEPEVTSADK